jgi:hypothetical protein
MRFRHPRPTSSHRLAVNSIDDLEIVLGGE